MSRQIYDKLAGGSKYSIYNSDNLDNIAHRKHLRSGGADFSAYSQHKLANIDRDAQNSYNLGDFLGDAFGFAVSPTSKLAGLATRALPQGDSLKKSREENYIGWAVVDSTANIVPFGEALVNIGSSIGSNIADLFQ